MKMFLMALALLVLCGASRAGAQTFSSGSTGADGTLDLSGGDRTVQLPDSGVLNYTTVNVPAGRILRFAQNRRNTPAVVLAQGDISIAGQINVEAGTNTSGVGSTAGPGGFGGGAADQPGLGPGGGQPEPGDTHGRWVGPASLVPIVGGSGGSGKTISGGRYSGGGGGGAIVLASSSAVIVSGYIYAMGAYRSGGDNGGFGSGGAVRVVANSVSVSGSINAWGPGHPGIIRLEGPLQALHLTGSTSPSAILASINPVIVPAQPPSLTIVSVGGFPVPSYSGTRRDTVDVTLPRSMAEPIDLVVHASQVPPGTPVSVTFSGANASANYVSATLQGTLDSSAAVLRLSGLTHDATVTFVFVFAVFDLPPTASAFNPAGPDQVAKLRVETAVGGESHMVFLRRDGSRIDPRRLAPELVRQFGQ